VDDTTIILLKKEIEEIKLLNKKLKELLKAQGDEKFYVIIETLVRLETKINDLMMNINNFLRHYSKLVLEVEEIKKQVLSLRESQNLIKTNIELILQEIKEMKQKKK
jgi:hypothetical protein